MRGKDDLKKRDRLFVLGLGGMVLSWPSLATIGSRRKGGYRAHRGGRLDIIVEPSEGGRGGRLGRHG
jgi:hypothetical protein